MNILLSKETKHDYSIITVHDCFGTLPNQMGELNFRVKKEFIILYSQNQFLTDFHHRLIQNIKDNQFEIINKNGKDYVELENNLLEIPKVPETGELNLNNILDSKYMIS